MLIDTLCHLDFRNHFPNPGQTLSEAAEWQVSYVVNPACCRADWSGIIKLANQFSALLPALGLHPCAMAEHIQEDLESMEEFVRRNKVTIIGGIGLDKAQAHNYQHQQAYLEAQLVLAQKLGMPVLIYSNRAHVDILTILKDVGFTQGGIIHDFNGSLEIAKAYLQRGFKLGIGPLLSHPNQHMLANCCKLLPLEAFVLETGSPEQSMYGTHCSNHPRDLVEVYGMFLKLRTEPEAEIISRLWQNSTRALSLTI